MGALLTHAAIGLILGLALRVPRRYLPVAIFLALSPDMDQLVRYFPLPVIRPRVTFHNVFFCALLPILVFWVLHRLDAPRDWQRMAGVAPFVMCAHLLTDVLMLESYSPGRVALFYPVAKAWYTVPEVPSFPGGTLYATHASLVLVTLTVGALATRHVVDGLVTTRAPGTRPAWRRGTLAAAYGVAWLLLIPAAATTSAVVSGPIPPDADLALDVAMSPDRAGLISLTVRQVGGEPIPRGALNLVLTAAGEPVAARTNPSPILPGGTWTLNQALPAGMPHGTEVEVRLVLASALQTVEYGAASFHIPRTVMDQGPGAQPPDPSALPPIVRLPAAPDPAAT